MDEMNMNEMVNEVKDIADVSDAQESKTGIIGKVVIGVAVAGIAGVSAFFYKNRSKRKEKMIAKLREQGYTITEPEEPIEGEVVEDKNSKKK